MKQKNIWRRVCAVVLVGFAVAVMSIGQFAPQGARPAHAAASPVFVQERDLRVGSGTTAKLAFSSANKAGNLIVVYVMWNNTSTVSVSDTRGNVYTSAVGPTIWDTGKSNAQIFYAKNIAAGSNTVTATFAKAVGTFGIIYIHEYSGADAVAPVDAVVAASGPSGSLNSGFLTTTNPNDLLFAGGASSRAVTAAGTGYTARSFGDGNITEDRAVSVTGSYNATAPQNGQAWVMLLTAFKGVSADSIPPTTPTSFSATSTSPSQVVLSWTASTDNIGVAGYKVFRNGNQVGSATGTSYVDSGLTPATLYSYGVSAFDGAGNNSSQATTTAMTQADVTPPSVPANLSAQAVSTSQINLAWSASTDNIGVSGYRVFRDGLLIATTSALTFQNTGLATGTTYSYAVSAFDAAGNSSATSSSAIATTFAPDTTPPSVPSNLQASGVTGTSLDFLWSASTDNVGVAGYQVYRNDTQVATTTVTNYHDALLTPSTTYQYTVSAFDGAGNVSATAIPELSVTTASSSGPYMPVYPVKQSTNKHYLVDQNNVPFIMVGDSPQSLIGNLSEADAATYFADRKAVGINTVWINLLCNSYTYCNSNGTTFDGIAPFTTPGDFSTPNPAYFQRVDDMINLAAQNGILVLLDPVETGGWLTSFASNSAAKQTAYGQYIGNRYKNFPNIVWLQGNDFQTWRSDSSNQPIIRVAQGILQADPNHLQTAELDYLVSASLDDAGLAPYLSLDAAYTYYPTYAEVLHGYNRGNFAPVFMIEANYEFQTNFNVPGIPSTLRHQEYWTMLSGATGQLYGNHYTVEFPSGWQSNLDTPGSTQLGIMKNFFAGYDWYDLVPDQAHTFVTAGYGTFNATGNMATDNYVTAALTPGGLLGMAYIPQGGAITVDMTKMAGPTVARWFDPSNGTYAVINGSPFANSGAQQFVTPGANNAGDPDWVLVLQSNDSDPPSVPANVVAQPISSSAILLTWDASTDGGTGVAGYQIMRDGVQVSTTTAATFTDTGLAVNSTHAYTLTAFDLAGNISAPSAQVIATTLPPDTTPPSVPTGFQTSNVNATTLTLSWTPSTDDVGVVGYQVFRNGLQIGTTTAATYNDSGLVASTTYAYAATAFDAAGNFSALSQPFNATTASVPAAPPQYIQGTQNEVRSGTTNAVSFGSALHAGNTVVVYLLWSNSGSATVTDSQGNTYTSAGPAVPWGSNSLNSQIFYARSAAGGADTVTAHFQTAIGSFGIAYIHEYSGISSVSPVRGTVAASGISTTLNSGNLSTPIANDLLFVGAGSDAGIAGAGPGYTLRNGSYGNLTEDQVASTTGTYGATATHNGNQWVMQLVDFIPGS